MDAPRLEAVLQDRLAGRRLLDHPFYQRWSRGEVSVTELRAYAVQYRHFEAALPGHLTAVADAAADDGLRDAALDNLADERTHLSLFDTFIDALGGPRHQAPSPAMRSLLDVYRAAHGRSAVEGFAALLAYEAQASGVAASKAEGLREHGILGGAGLRFWDLHATVDTDHARWAVEALEASCDDVALIGDAIEQAAIAWWDFLNEREALRA